MTSMRTTTSSETRWGESRTSFGVKNDLAKEKGPRTTSEGKQGRSPAAILSPGIPPSGGKQASSPAAPPPEG